MAAKVALSRQIGLLPLVIYYFSTIVGVGIFLVPLHAARIAGPASLLSWLLVLIMIYPFAMIFAHISQVYQTSGSIQKFIEDSAGFRFGKAMALFMAITAMFGNSLLGYAAARYIMELIGYSHPTFPMILGLGVLTLSCLFNLLSMGLSSKIQTVTLITLVIILELVAMASLPSYKIDHMTPFMPNGFSSIVPAMLICFYSVVGWENVDAIAEEVKEPVKNYKHAIRISLVAIALFYMSIALTVIFVMSPDQIKESNTVISSLLKITMGENAAKAGGVLAIVLLFLGANVWILGTSRIIFALARDKVLPGILTTLNKDKIPVMAVVSQLIVYAIISLLMILTNVEENTIIEIASLNYLLLYMVIFFCGIIKFTTRRLKLLSGFSIAVSTLLLVHSANHVIGLSLALALLCFSHVYLVKHKSSHR